MVQRALVPFFLIAACSVGSILPASPLQEALDVQKKNFEDRVPDQKVASDLRGIDFVRKSGLLQTAKNVGDRVDFTLPNAQGVPVSLKKLLADGPVVVTWYRGGWSPYCNLALQEYQSRIEDFQQAGVQLVALTPELPDIALATVEKNTLDLTVLTDRDNAVADQEFGIVMKLAPEIEEAMRNFANLKKQNGSDDDKATLPLAATYLIDRGGGDSLCFLGCRIPESCFGGADPPSGQAPARARAGANS